MAKRGRIATPIELIREGQCIELDNQLIIRISSMEKVTVTRYYGEDEPVTGFMLFTYANRVQVFYEDHALVDLVDESTLTQVPFD